MFGTLNAQGQTEGLRTEGQAQSGKVNKKYVRLQ